MVLDNADDPDTFFVRPTSTTSDNECISSLSEYLPRSLRGFTLITTRDERLGKRLAGIHALVIVNQMSPQEAHDLLEKWQTGPLDSSGNDPSMRLLEALGYIPLAITQAAAFISANHISLIKYLEMFNKSDSDVQDLLNEDVGDRRRDAHARNSIIKTWKMSFDLINTQELRAAEMLSLMAVLDRQEIPEILLRQKTDRNIDLTKALGTLRAFSLVSVGIDDTKYEIHRLVQLATRKWLENQGRIGVWQEKALLVVANMFPSAEFETWKTCVSLLPHAQKVIQNADVNEKYPLQFSRLLYKIAWFDINQGRYEIACARFSAAIEVEKQILGIDHKSTLNSMYGLANTIIRQRRFEEAEKLLMQIIEAMARTLGAEHRDTLGSMHNLATTYVDQGRLEEGEKLHMQVLEAQKRVLGAQHPDTLGSINSLATVYIGQGRGEEAEKFQLQILEIFKRVLRAEHPDMLNSMNNLATTYIKQGRWEEAEKLYLQVLEAKKRVLGAEHPDTLLSMYNQAICWKNQGRQSEATELMEKVFELRTKRLGAKHADTKNAEGLLRRWLDS